MWGDVLFALSHDTNWMAAIVAIYFFKRLSLPLKIVGIYHIIFPLHNLFGKYLALTYQNNMPSIHSETHLQFIMYWLFFYLVFSQNYLKKIMLGIFVFYVVISTICTIYWDNIFEPPGTINMVVTCIMMALSLTYFFQIYSESKILYVEKDPNFLVGAAILLINMSYIFLEYFNEYLNKHNMFDEVDEFFFTIKAFVYFIYIFSIISAFFISAKRKESYPNLIINESR